MNTRTNTDLLATESSGISECLDRLSDGRLHHRPVSTYRFQFNAGFRFQDAIGLVPYLHALGITHCYASPILKARAGSMHGYDITDHNAINPEIGTEDELRQLVAGLKARGMGLILDIVPNHMGVGQGDNPWWQDVLENGRTSEYSSFFDIDWQPVKTELHDKVLIPTLGDQYGTELEAGNIILHFEDGRFFLSYYDNSFPVDPQTVPIVFEPLGDLRAHAEAAAVPEAERSELENILWDLRRLPPHTTTDPELAIRRRDHIIELRRRLRDLIELSPQVLKLIHTAVRLCNGEPGKPHTFDALHRLLEAQAYRLAHWRVSAQEINYRRFFDINDLVGLRMEDPRVFAATHRLIRRLLAEDLVCGLRLDHPDGLLNPVQHFIRTQMLYAASQCCGPEPIPPLADNGIEVDLQELFGKHDWMHLQSPLYLIVEKILERGENLPLDWPVDGTVGYDFTNLVNGIFIDQSNARYFTNAYRRFVGGPIDFDTLLYESKKLIMETALSSEVTVLSHLLEEIANSDRHARDFTRTALTEAIRETIACFPVYRTYTDERGNISARDREFVSQAIIAAKRRNPSVTASLFDFLRDILLLLNSSRIGEHEYRRRVHFVLKFQQLTGPVMAKGMEDTVCYVYNRFISLNEVGGSPKEFGLSVDEFHRGNAERAGIWPYALLATSTHDTKRSEDVRARMNVLSEMPRLWAANVTRWRRMNRPKKRAIGDGRLVPDFNEEYLLYQTLVGAWPLHINGVAEHNDFARRIKAYMSKAVHEGKVNLSWVNQNPEYVEALERFIDRILCCEAHPNQFLAQIENFVSPLIFFGAINSLSQTLLKITAPGVPDTYQGNEIWDFSLVDPDNRRPVDYHLRQSMIHDISSRAQDRGSLSALCDDLLAHFDDGRIKLWTTMRALNFRREHAPLFQTGAYVPLDAVGEKADHVIAFARERHGGSAVTLVPRFAYTLMKGQVVAPVGAAWGETELAVVRASTDYENVFTGEVVKSSNARTLLCREVFAHFPVALLAAR
jgi:(1->4)-alpha-D-glucan 1-alpha-D-glucosylmutase